MNELYIRFLIWLGAAPPEEYQYQAPSEGAEKSSFRILADFGFSLIRLLIPFDNFVIHTNLTPEEIQQKLSEVVEPGKRFRFPFSNHKRYQGAVNGNKFKFSKIKFFGNSFPSSFYGNSYPSLIQGEVYPNPKGTIIEIRMRLQTFVMVPLIIWYSIWTWVILSGMAVVLQSESPSSELTTPLLFLCMAFGGFGWLVSILLFNRGVVAEKAFLHKLFV